MANSRYLSICKFFTVVLISAMISSVGLANSGQKAFREKDVMTADTDREWVFENLLLSLINVDNPKKLWGIAPNDEIRSSLVKVRNARHSQDTAAMFQPERIVDLVYSYSWSDTAPIYFLGSSVASLKNAVTDADVWLASKTVYKNEAYIVTAVAGAVTVAGLGLKQICTKPPQGQPAPKGQGQPAQQVAGGSRIGNFVTNYLIGPAAGITGWLLAHSAVLNGLAAWEVCATLGNIYVAGPHALAYYTDRIILASDSLNADGWPDTIYRYQGKSGKDYYRGYINMDSYYKMLRAALNIQSAVGSPKIHFGHATAEIAKKLEPIHRAAELYGRKLETPVLRYCSKAKTPADFNSCRTTNKEAIKKVISDSECRKYTLFNRSLHPKDETPLYMFTLCGTPEEDALVFAKMTGVRSSYARMSKASVLDFVTDVVTYTGSTVLVSQSSE